MTTQTVEDPVEYIQHVLDSNPGKDLARIISDLIAAVNDSSAYIQFAIPLINPAGIPAETLNELLRLEKRSAKSLRALLSSPNVEN